MSPLSPGKASETTLNISKHCRVWREVNSVVNGPTSGSISGGRGGGGDDGGCDGSGWMKPSKTLSEKPSFVRDVVAERFEGMTGKFSKFEWHISPAINEQKSGEKLFIEFSRCFRSWETTFNVVHSLAKIVLSNGGYI